MPDSRLNQEADNKRYVCHYKNRTFYGKTQEEALQKMADYMTSEKGSEDAPNKETALETPEGRTL